MSDFVKAKDELYKTYLRTGIEGLSEREALVLLLSYALPQKDPFLLADDLLLHFGSLSGIFQASADELSHTDGLGENGAFLFKLIPQVYRRIQISRTSRRQEMHTPEEYGDYFSSLLAAQTNEILYELCLNEKHQILLCRKVSEGDSERVSVSRRKIAENAIQCNASIALLAHNHPGGVASPSPEDLTLTRQVFRVLKATGIYLEDHIIVSDTGYISLRQAGMMEDCR